jgi:hypothetical protein
MKPNGSPESRARSFLEYLKRVQNPGLVNLAKRLLEAGAGVRANGKALILRMRDQPLKINFNVRLNGESTVWQYTRFDGDIDYWRRELGKIELEPKRVTKRGKTGSSLQFQLITTEHFTKFEPLIAHHRNSN